MIPIAAINAAVYGHRHRDTSKANYDIDMNKVRELHEKRNSILDYLEKQFKVDKITLDGEPTNFTIYELRFGNSYGVGIRVLNELIIKANINWLYRYCYELVFDELIKDTKERYVNDLESKGE